MQPLLSLVLFIHTSLLPCTVSASPLNFNTSVASFPDSSRSHTTYGSSQTTDSHGSYIMKGLGTGGSASGPTTSALPPKSSQSLESDPRSTGSPVICGSIQADQNNSTYCTATATSTYALYEAVFTTTSNSLAPPDMSSAMQCWSSIATWRNSSAIWWNSKIASRTWNITSVYSSTATLTYQTKTIYPSSVSTYKLCDGSPRADIRPKTEHFSGNTTLYGSFTTTLMPTFSPQPCSLTPKDCRILYHDTNIESVDDRELLRQCGSPAHLDTDAQCLIGGGPVELIYFPVARDNTSLCTNRTSSGPISARPLIPGLSEITTLGHTFTSDSVYISFKTLFASYDGFWDKIGPTFSDYIVPLHSSDISTQCGGWDGARLDPTGTALDYADLNWPVPASAYKCQNRCSLTYSTYATLMGDDLLAEVETLAPAPECSTIWSDINPVLAVPTKIRDMVPEWKSCSFWNQNIANFWFDPPIALQPVNAEATPTLPTRPTSTPAAAASTPSSPISATSTHIAKTTDLFVSSSVKSQDQFPEQTTADTANAPVSSQTETREPANQSTDSESDSVTTASVSRFTFSYNPASSSGNLVGGGEAGDPAHQNEGSLPSTSVLDPTLAAAPAFSVLTVALSTFQNTRPTPSASTEEISASQETFVSVAPGPKGSSSVLTASPQTAGSPGALLTLGSSTFTALRTSEYYIIGSTTVSIGQVATISNTPVSADSSWIVIDGTIARMSTLSDPAQTDLQAGEALLTATASESNIMSFAGGSAITRGGGVLTMEDVTATYGSDGLVLISSGSTIPFSTLVAGTTSSRLVMNVTSLPSVVFSTTESRYWPTMTAVSSTTSSGASTDYSKWLLWFLSSLSLYIIIM